MRTRFRHRPLSLPASSSSPSRLIGLHAPHDSDADCTCPPSSLTRPRPVMTRMSDHLLPPFRSDRALAPHDSDAVSKANHIFPGEEPAGAGALRQNTLDSRPSTRAHVKPLDPGPRPALRRGRPLHLLPYAATLKRAGPGTPQALLLLSSGDENGVRPPWAAMSLSRARKGRITKGKAQAPTRGGGVCNTSP